LCLEEEEEEEEEEKEKGLFSPTDIRHICTYMHTRTRTRTRRRRRPTRASPQAHILKSILLPVYRYTWTVYSIHTRARAFEDVYLLLITRTHTHTHTHTHRNDKRNISSRERERSHLPRCRTWGVGAGEGGVAAAFAGFVCCWCG